MVKFGSYLIHLFVVVLKLYTTHAVTYTADNVVPAISEIPRDIPVAVQEAIITNNAALTSLPANVFSANAQLRVIDLSDNKISNVDFSAFVGTNLTVLHLDGNSLSNLPNLDVPDLVQLDVSGNAISYLSATLTGYKKLEVLDLTLNPLQIYGASFSGLWDVTSTLRVLDITSIYGMTNSYNPDDFPSHKFTSLNELHMNRIVSVPELPPFADWIEKLEKLELEEISLSDSVVQGMTQTDFIVKQLDLAINNLTVFPDFSNIVRPHFQTISLRSNSLTSLGPDRLEGMTQLYYLSLDSNLLVTFPNFPSLSLTGLSLEDNLITYIPAAPFFNLTLLKNLYISSNPVVVVEDLSLPLAEMLLPSVPLTVDIRGASLACNCSFVFIYHGVNSLAYVDFNVDSLPCASPDALTSVSMSALTLAHICYGTTTTTTPLPTTSTIPSTSYDVTSTSTPMVSSTVTPQQSNISCQPIPVWLDISVVSGSTDPSVGQTLQYTCKEGFEFEDGSEGNIETTCSPDNGVWNPEFKQCQEQLDADAAALFAEPVEAPRAVVIGSFTFLFVVIEVTMIILCDLGHWKRCCRRLGVKCCKPSNKVQDILHTQGKGKPSPHGKRISHPN